MALLHLARWAAPRMEAAGGGALLVTGNPSAFRDKAGFAGFAPIKATQRILTEAIAREMGPRGVHASLMMIDAVIDVPWARGGSRTNRMTFSSSHPTSQKRSGTSPTSRVRPGRF